MAIWLDTVCHGFDYAILQAIHNFALEAGSVFAWLMEAITLLCDDGLGMIALGLVLCLFKRTRKLGTAVLFSVAFAAIITNLTLKPLVERARPYTHEAYIDWWRAMGAHTESDRSFPSGHTTAAMAAMTAIFLHTNKKYSWTAFLFALLMGFTRLFLVVHYPTDVIAGLIAGAVGAVIAYFAIRALFYLLEKHRDKKLCRLFLELDPVVSTVRRLCQKRESAPSDESDPT